MNMTKNLKVLLLEDREDDAHLLIQAIRRAGYVLEWRRVENEETYRQALTEGPDLILADYNLPQFTGLKALHILQEMELHIPFIIVTGTLEEAALQCMKEGAADYLLKDRLSRLGEAVRRALEEKHIRQERTQALADLRESEARFRRLAENAPDIIYRFELNPTPTLQFINHAVLHVTGYAPEAFYGDPTLFARLIHPDDIQILEDFFSTEMIYRYVEYRCIHRDGAVHWIQSRNTLVYDQNDQIIALEGIGRDVTEIKEAEHAEREQRRLAEALRDTATILNSTLTLEAVFNGILQQVGRVAPHDGANIMLIEEGTARVVACHGHYQQKEVTELVMNLRFTVADTPNLRTMVETKRPFIIPDTKRDPVWRASPATHWVKSHLSAPIQREGHVIGFLNLDSETPDFFNASHAERLQAFANHTATALQNARLYEELTYYSEKLEQMVDQRTAELQQLIQQTDTILHNSPDAILLLTPACQVKASNRTFHRSFGYTQAEAEKLPPQAFVAPEDRSRLAQAVEKAIEGQQTERIELVAQSKNGRHFDVEAAIAPIIKENTVTGLVCNLHDISALKEVERMKDAFIANVSHELRTPITNLQLHSDLIRRNPEKQATYMERISRETIRLGMIVEDLLRLSRLEQGYMALDKTPFDLNDLLQQYVDDRKNLARQKSLRLELILVTEPAIVNADQGLIGQVLSILLTNALNYTPPPGTITISAQRQETNGKKWAGFSIKDSGPGILPEEMHQLFERFYRGAAARLSGEPGTGLGLSIVKEIIERHNGRIDAKNAPDKGAIFTIWLPA